MNTFAAWDVEARQDEQILLSDYKGRTRSWLMSEALDNTNRPTTRLYFGSAVIPIRGKESEAPRMGKTFQALLQFHKLYSQALLSSVKRKLTQ